MLRSGLLTRGELRSSAWRRIYRDVYVCATVPLTHQVKALAAAAVLFPGAVVTGRSAAVLWGLDDAAGPDDVVTLCIPAGRSASAVPGVRVHRRDLPPEDVTWRRRVKVLTAAATAIDIARHTALDQAVVVVDQLVVAELVGLGDIRTAAMTLTGPGCRRARAVADLADGLAGSPQETRLRLLLHRSQLPRPVAQFSVRHGGRFVARVDFAWPEKKVAVEYDGLWHGQPGQFAADRRRLNGLTAAGWRVVFVTARDLAYPEALLRRIAAELAR